MPNGLVIEVGARGDDRRLAALPGIEAEFHRRMKSRTFRTGLRVKRMVDIIGGTLLLLLVLPLLVAAMLAVKLSSPGPVLYAAPRWGYRGNAFICLKLRTMRIDRTADMAASGLSTVDASGRVLVHARDPRITPVGAFLRASSIDELPQLVNVIRGQMSLVGPRPLDISMLARHDSLRDTRGLVRPGITGLWQVTERRKNVDALDMLPRDLEYIDRLSPWLDARILLRTPGKMLLPA